MEKEVEELIKYTIKLLDKSKEQQRKIEEQKKVINNLKEQIK